MKGINLPENIRKIYITFEGEGDSGGPTDVIFDFEDKNADKNNVANEHYKEKFLFVSRKILSEYVTGFEMDEGSNGVIILDFSNKQNLSGGFHINYNIINEKDSDSNNVFSKNVGDSFVEQLKKNRFEKPLFKFINEFNESFNKEKESVKIRLSGWMNGEAKGFFLTVDNKKNFQDFFMLCLKHDNFIERLKKMMLDNIDHHKIWNEQKKEFMIRLDFDFLIHVDSENHEIKAEIKNDGKKIYSSSEPESYSVELKFLDQLFEKDLSDKNNSKSIMGH